MPSFPTCRSSNEFDRNEIEDEAGLSNPEARRCGAIKSEADFFCPSWFESPAVASHPLRPAFQNHPSSFRFAMDAMIECDGLTKRFGNFTAVNHVTFSVGRGSIFGFLGPNGSGKSTVIRMLCGILEPSEGTARIDGRDVVRESEAIKEMIGYMSQQFSLYDELTVNENLLFSGKLYSLPDRELKKRRDELIALTHLQPYLNRRAGLLSGGWRQRLAMACALMHEPTVLFLDEPTAGIDPVARRELWDLLFEFAGRGMTLFVTTHYMDEAERCSHVGYIHMSKLIVSGQPDDLKHLPEVNPPGTRRLDVTCDHVTQALQAMRAAKGVRSATVFGQSMHLLVDDALTSDEIKSRLRAVGIQEVDIHPIGPSLEDVFVALTAKYSNNGAEEKAA
jgi:ABC-type multidrug transport system ATPase subunit